MTHDRDTGASAGIVRLGETFPILGLSPALKNNYYGNDTIGYRNFLLADVEGLPPLKMQVVASPFMRYAARFLSTDKLTVSGNKDEFIRDGLVEPTGEVHYGVTQVSFPADSALLRLRLQVSLGHITYEANPNYANFFKGNLTFGHFYIANRSEDDSRGTLRYTDLEPLMAILDNSEEAYASSIGDGELRYELVGDIKKEENPKVRGRFLLKEFNPEENVQFFSNLLNFLKRITEG